jgi:polar amino acid transport system substrate-binding protein
LKSSPKGVKIAFGNDPLRDNLRLLVDGGLDVVVDATAVLAFTVDKMGIKGRVVAAGNGGEPLKMYIAFSPADPKAKVYADMMSAGTAALRKSGELKKLLARYGLPRLEVACLI